MGPPVDQNALARDVAGVSAAQVGTEPSHFQGIAKTLRRQLRPACGEGLLRAHSLLLGPEGEVADQPVGGEGPGQDVVDRDVSADVLAYQGADQSVQAGARCGT